jgi:hypothetical protein
LYNLTTKPQFVVVGIVEEPPGKVNRKISPDPSTKDGDFDTGLKRAGRQ